MTAASHSSWASPGWSQLILTAAASCVLTWLAFAARSGVDPHAGWRQSVRALAPRSASDAAHSWPSSLRYACECVLHAAPSPQHAAPQAVLARNLPKASSMSQRVDSAGGDLTNVTAWAPVATQMAATGFSQSGEDMHAYTSYFHSMVGGTFLEMGALDGQLFSNTLLFETFLGWKGVLVEPSPKNFQRLVINRPGSVQVNAAICSRSAMVHYVDSSNAESLHSTLVNGVREFMSEQFQLQWAGILDQGTVTEVPCMPLGKLLADLRISHINFFSLDVEGAELSVLQTVDFRRVRFDVIAVEADGSNPVKDQQVVDLFADKGYTFRYFLHPNAWFMRQGFTPSQQP